MLAGLTEAETRLGCRLGILTRNTLSNAVATLTHCGLERFFAECTAEEAAAEPYWPEHLEVMRASRSQPAGSS